MRVTFILPWHPVAPSGGFRVVYEYANYLTQRGHDVSVLHARYCKPYKDPPLTWPHGARELWRTAQHNFRALRRPRIPWQYIDARVRLLMAPDEPLSHRVPDGDVVFATAWQTASYVAEYPRNKGIPCYLIQGWEVWAGPEDAVRNSWFLPLNKVVVSRWLEEIGRSLGVQDLIHIPNAINQMIFRCTKPLGGRPPAIVSLYHSAKQKGVEDAIQVLRMIHERHPQVPATFFGVAPRGRDIPDWVAYVQNPSPVSLVKLYNAHSIYLGASWNEGWALPPAEAMACGCAFVGTDSGGCRDYAIHDQTALLSPPRDPATLYRNLARVVDDAGLRRALQDNGHAYIETFSWERSGKALEQWMRRLSSENASVIPFRNGS